MELGVPTLTLTLNPNPNPDPDPDPNPNQAVELGVPVVETDKGTLNNYCRNRPHQGLVLQARPP